MPITTSTPTDSACLLKDPGLKATQTSSLRVPSSRLGCDLLCSLSFLSFSPFTSAFPLCPHSPPTPFALCFPPFFPTVPEPEVASKNRTIEHLYQFVVFDSSQSRLSGNTSTAGGGVIEAPRGNVRACVMRANRALPVWANHGVHCGL